MSRTAPGSIPASPATPTGRAEPIRPRLAREPDTDAFFTMGFDTAAGSSSPAFIEVPLQRLGAGAALECWGGPRPVRLPDEAGVATFASADHVIVHGRRAIGSDADVADATQAIYTRLLQRAFSLGYPHLVRVWNLIPDINLGSGDAERYVRFNQGRVAAFAALGEPLQFPAATCVGGAVGTPLVVAALASRVKPLVVDNPRQTSPHRYPRQYGPSPPAFSRAMLLPDRQGGGLYVSGTASIVGHESRHLTIETQLEETLANVAELTGAAQRISGCDAGARRSWRVYLRNAADLARVERTIGGRLGGADEIVYLRADICRRELMVEVEGFCELVRGKG